MSTSIIRVSDIKPGMTLVRDRGTGRTGTVAEVTEKSLYGKPAVFITWTVDGGVLASAKARMIEVR